MIVLRFPDGSERQLEDSEAKRLADLLWDMADGRYAATIAAAIQQELRHGVQRTVDVFERNAPRVAEALSRMH